MRTNWNLQKQAGTHWDKLEPVFVSLPPTLMIQVTWKRRQCPSSLSCTYAWPKTWKNWRARCGRSWRSWELVATGVNKVNRQIVNSVCELQQCLGPCTDLQSIAPAVHFHLLHLMQISLVASYNQEKEIAGNALPAQISWHSLKLPHQVTTSEICNCSTGPRTQCSFH